jgi:glyceraldehyde-3-phosphate dehydrogenase (NAD(P))
MIDLLRPSTSTLARDADRDEVLAALRGDRRIAFVRSADGLGAPNRTIELMKDLGRPRGDMYEVAVWSDILAVAAGEAFLTYQVDNQAIVIPENVDAIRALVGVVSDAEESMRRTDDALGIRQDFLG